MICRSENEHVKILVSDYVLKSRLPDNQLISRAIIEDIFYLSKST